MTVIVRLTLDPSPWQIAVPSPPYLHPPRFMKAIFFLLFFLPLIGFSQATNKSDQQISIGVRPTIHSSILKEDRELLIAVPGSGVGGKLIQYPVMYLLDGPAFFNSVTTMLQYLNSAGKAPEMIVVGIANTNRTRDLTPSHAISWFDGEKDSAALGSSGGGEQFLAFIEKELIPYIDSMYKPAPYRMFVGHSLGGLTVLNALINHPDLFTSYVAIDPSVWWDDRKLMGQASRVLRDKDFSRKALFYASANTMEKGMDTLRVEHDTAHASVHVRDNLQFRNILGNSSRSRLHWDWRYYPEDDHGSVPFIASYDALRFIFKAYAMDKDLNDSSITASYIASHCREVSALLHYSVLPSENMVNLLGYRFLSDKRYDKAYEFFKMNIENYPSSANVYDSMGDLYVEQKNTKMAIAFFEKALLLKEMPETRKKLQNLKQHR